MDKLNLKVGDFIRYLGSRSFAYEQYLKEGGTYEIKEVEYDHKGHVVYRFKAPIAVILLWHPQGELYPDAFEPAQVDEESTSLAHDDYNVLLDLALDTNDSEWFHAILEEMESKGEIAQ